MVSKLRKKIVLIIMSIVGIFTIVSAVVLSIYFSNKTREELFSSMNYYIEQTSLQNPQTQIGNNNLQKLAPTPICVVEYFSATNTAVILSNNSYIDENTLTTAISEVISSQNQSGVISSGLVYVLQQNPMSTKIAFADNSYLTTENTSIWLTATIVSVAILVCFFAISLLLAKIIVKPVEETLEQQKRFIADASHELKTPLSVILANNNILKTQTTNAQKEWLESNEEEIKHMSSIIQDMLTLAQGEMLTTIITQDVNISNLLNKICLSFDTIAYEKNIKLNYKISKNLKINCDEKMTKQLFMILIDNAIKYEKNGGKIQIKLQKNNKKIIFSINNKNSVISEEDLPHIFDRFYRADHARTSGGVGLGLAIAKQIVSLHNAKIFATSSKKDGTTFEVIF